MHGITLQDIYAAKSRISPPVRHTPLIPSPYLSELTGRDVRLKLETMQDIGAFKLRGAVNKILSLSDEERACGVIAVSTGNHGRGVAYAAKRLGIKAVICMSHLVPKNKVDGIKALGAEVVLSGRSQDDAEVEAAKLIKEHGYVEVHPFDDHHVIAGQGTAGIEILEDMPELDTAIIPLSGGGLFAGIALALKASNPDIKLVGVTMERGPAMIDSIAAGKPVPVEEFPSLADSLGGGIGLDNKLSFKLCRDLIDESVLVSEEEIAEGMRTLYREDRIVAEGGASVGVAALLQKRVKSSGDHVALLISGRNVDMDKHAKIIAGGMPELE